MRSIRKILSLIMFLFLLEVSAQSDTHQGYIISLGGDSIKADIAISERSKYYELCQTKSNEEFQTHAPKDIKGFGYGNYYYVSGVVRNGFVRVIVEGAMSLFQYKGKFYITKEGEEPTVLDEPKMQIETNTYKDPNWKRILNYLISDCNNGNPVDKVNFNAFSIAKYVNAYNDCTGSSSLYQARKGEELQFKWGFEMGGGFAISNLTLSSDVASHRTYKGTYTSSGPTYGLNVSCGIPSKTGLSLNVGVHFMNTSIEETTTIGSRDFPLTLSFKEILVPISLKFNPIERKSFLLYTEGGLGFSIIQDFSIDPELFEFNGNQTFAMVGLGFERNFGSIRSGVSVRYMRGFTKVEKTLRELTNHTRLLTTVYVKI